MPRRPARPPMDEAHIFVTKDPAILANFEAFPEQCAKARRAFNRLMKKISPPTPDGSKRRIYTGSRNPHRLDFVGLGFLPSEWRRDAIPVGWKREDMGRGTGSLLTPKRNTPEGKAIAAQLKAFDSKRPPHLDEILLGMPAELMQFGGARMTTYRPGLWWAEDHSALYAEWSDTAAPIEKVDPKLWKPLWLSDFRRLVEDGAVVTVRS